MIVKKILVVVGLLSLVGGWLWRGECAGLGCALAGGNQNGIYCVGANNDQVFHAFLMCKAAGTLVIIIGIVLLIVAYFKSGRPTSALEKQP